MSRHTSTSERAGRAGQGAPQDELVVSIDRRLMAVVGGLVLVALVATGAWIASRGGGPAPVAQGLPVDPNAAATQAVIAQMREAGMNPTAAGQVVNVEHSTAEATMSAPGQPPQIIPLSQMTASSPSEATQMAMPGVQGIINRPNTADASQWPHDVLHNYPDPNVDNPLYSPERIEAVEGTLKGPRVAIGDLNDLFSFDYGVVPGDEIAAHDFRLKNVGDEPLLISRVYTGCGCTATKIKDTVLDAAGFVLPEPLSIAPGEETTFTVEYDPRVEAGQGGRARHKFIQIFSNDPTKAVFDPATPNQHEARFRIVIEPRYGYNKAQIATQEAVAQATKDANKQESAP